MTTNTTIGASLPSMAMDEISNEFHLRTSSAQRVLPISLYLIGNVVGPVVWAPISERFGRQVPCNSTFLLFTILTMVCGFAPSWAVFLVCRLSCGILGSCPFVVGGGALADIHHDPNIRGLVYAAYMVVSFIDRYVSSL